ncbi:cutinase-domain-containing protein [Geopyxis carbonaria]|nr:cutinase-domain-containing protein [Geopyxis carbonaria]
MLAALLLLLPALAAAAPYPSALAAADLPTTTITSTVPALALEEAFANLRASKVVAADVAAAVVTTRSELKSGQCDDIIVIFARGTTEPGNVGDDVGPQFFDALVAAEPGRVIVQGVDNYAADIWGFLGGGSDDGAADMAASVKLVATQCPNSKIWSTYSQGAQVTHKAAKLIPTNLYGLVGAIVLFGDPNNGDAFPGTLNKNVKTFCHDGDLICDGWPIPTDAHSTYENDAPAAAAYVAALL